MSDTSSLFPIGLAGEERIRVSPELATRHLGGDVVPVFATPELVRLMEHAAVNALAAHLAPGQQSVGTMVDIRHLAATPLGATVTAHAELIAVDGRRLLFRVTASDGLDLIGAGMHERALIDLDRFGAKVRAKHKRTE